MTPEFHADLSFWKIVVVLARTIGEGSLKPPLHSFYLQPYSNTLVPDASVTRLSLFW